MIIETLRNDQGNTILLIKDNNTLLINLKINEFAVIKCSLL